MDRLVTALAPLPPPARRSITFDRGLEFTAWRELGAGLEMKARLADDAIRSICERLNTTPRKCLGYRTPAEAFRREMRRIT